MLVQCQPGRIGPIYDAPNSAALPANGSRPRCQDSGRSSLLAPLVAASARSSHILGRMPYAFHTADVFTDHLHGGNPLAVIPDARGLSDAQMQAITREFNYSETVFVFPPEQSANTRRVRIFTPEMELPFAGHPTVGCAFVLASMGAIPLNGDETRIVLEEGVGPVPVLIRAKGGKPTFAQLTSARLPEIKDPPPPPETLCEILSLEPSHIVADDMLEPEAVSCGVPYLFIPLKKPEMLSWVKVDAAKWEQALRDYWAPEMYVFSADDWSNIFEGGEALAPRSPVFSRYARKRVTARCAGMSIKVSRWAGRAGSSWKLISSAGNLLRSELEVLPCSLARERYISKEKSSYSR